MTVQATAANSQGVTAPGNVTLTIADDEPPVVTVAAETATVTEGADAVFVLTRASADIATSLVVDFTLADPDSVLDGEAPATATIPADETTVKVTLATDDDSADEPHATLTLRLTDGATYDLGASSSATVTVQDNDPHGQDKASDAAVTVAAVTATVTEGANAVFTLTRTGDLSNELAVTFTVTGDIAVLTDTPPAEATFGADADTAQVALATDDDTADEPHAALTLTLTDGDDYYPGHAVRGHGDGRGQRRHARGDADPHPGPLDRGERREEHGDGDAGPPVERGYDVDGVRVAGVVGGCGRLHAEREPGTDGRGGRDDEHGAGDSHRRQQRY